ncbi:LppU/SCO3897 family protein [Mycobacterium ostraviense]|uniref:Uncharacterized protein n=1 Tax=Mycobacterium ostraviense TaxID=2738409 RepID=A0A164E8Z2_9MYCO|nr:hypothetical protein [Mycobacterium ostraviense]KZS67189.1 hypothetical protein A4G28_20985 [Mycobacterium ostraviense]UGT90110.1 hypothetical protein LTS72_17160 [Mycobacterium ostraviense]
MNAAAMAGTIVGSLLLPVTGVILLIAGIRKRSAAREQASIGYSPGYPPPAYPAAGQPGYGGYPPGYPMPPQPKSAGTGLIVTGIVLLAVGALAVVGTLANAVRHSTRLAIGDCLTNAILTDNPDWRPSSCSNKDAVLQYAANTDSIGNCPDGKRNDSSYLSAEHNGVRMCFAANLLQGQCYASEHDDKTVRQTSCTSGTVRIVKRVDGGTDASACPKRTRALTYTQPKRTYCTERVGSS